MSFTLGMRRRVDFFPAQDAPEYDLQRPVAFSRSFESSRIADETIGRPVRTLY